MGNPFRSKKMAIPATLGRMSGYWTYRPRKWSAFSMIDRVFPLTGGVFWPSSELQFWARRCRSAWAIEMKLGVERQIEVNVRAPHD
jgi:hypothetical protein